MRRDKAVRVNAGTLNRLFLAYVKVHCFSDEQIPPAHLGFWRNVLGVGMRGDGMFARIRYDQKRIGVVERG